MLANIPKAYLLGHSLMLISASLFSLWLYTVFGSTGGASGKETAYQCRRHKRHWFNPWMGKIPWRRKWQPTLVFLPGESSLEGYSP